MVEKEVEEDIRPKTIGDVRTMINIRRQYRDAPEDVLYRRIEMDQYARRVRAYVVNEQVQNPPQPPLTANLDLIKRILGEKF